MAKKLRLDDKPIKAPPQPTTRKDVEAALAKANQRILALENELTIQHQRANDVVRLLGYTFTFNFQLQNSYIEAMRHYAAEKKPVPAMWLASRLCEYYATVLETPAAQEQRLVPDPTRLATLQQMTAMPLLPGTPIHGYLAQFKPPVPDTTAAVTGKKGKSK